MPGKASGDEQGYGTARDVVSGGEGALGMESESDEEVSDNEDEESVACLDN